MLKTPSSDQQCSSSPISGLAGSVESVVFPVPDSPKKSVTSPEAPMLHPECSDRIPRLGIR